jgi:hypothetical protein
VPGEAFASYIDRLAALHKVNRLVILTWLGLFEDEQFTYISGFGAVLDNAMLERFSTAAQLSKNIVEGMLLSSYNGIALDLSSVDFAIPNTFRTLPIFEWAYFSGSHACPHCLLENHGAWQLSWKLPWTFACLKHQCYLVSHCPACGQRLARGSRAWMPPTRPWSLQMPELGHCNNLYGDRIQARFARCDYELTKIATTHAGPSALRVQKLLNRHLSGQEPIVLGSCISPLEYFHDLRALCQFILFAADLDVFGYLPAAELIAFRKFANERPRLSTPQKKSDFGHRDRCPENAELMAAVTRLATSILAADAGSMKELLRPLTERFTSKSKIRWKGLELYGFSDRLSSVITTDMQLIGSFDYTVGGKAAATRKMKIAFGPQHVPHLLWQEDFDRSFATFFPRLEQTTARRFCAMALVKLCGGYSWAQATAQLDLPEHFIYASGDGLKALRQTGTLQEFAEALRDVARRLSNDPNKIDYSMRRKVLSTLIEIPEEPWSKMCHEAGIPPCCHVGLRRKYAAAWLWGTLTGGEWFLAPGLVGEKPSNVRGYRKHYEQTIPKVALHLLAYGYQLLKNQRC